MKSIPHDLEQIKSPPYDFILITSIQEQPGKNNYSAGGIHLFQNSATGKVNEGFYLTDTFKLPEGEIYDKHDGVNQCAKLFNDGEIRRAKEEADKAAKLYSTPATEDRLNYYEEVYLYFDKWYHENGIALPAFDVRPTVVYSVLTTRKDANGVDYVDFLYDEKGPAQSDEEKLEEIFSHSPDYSTVKMRGKEFELKPGMAVVIELLHKEYKVRGRRGKLYLDYILKEVASRIKIYPSRVRYIFSTNIPAFKELIECIKKDRGHYRLNL